MVEYSALRARLKSAADEGADRLFLTFEEVESLCGPLPSEAYLKKGWWTGARQPHVGVWLSEGWVVDTVGFGMRRVALRRLSSNGLST